MARSGAIWAYVLLLIIVPTLLSWLAVDWDKVGENNGTLVLLYISGILGVLSWISWSIRLLVPQKITAAASAITIKLIRRRRRRLDISAILAGYAALNALMSFIVAVCITIVLVFAFINVPPTVLDIQLGLVLLVLSAVLQYLASLLLTLDARNYYQQRHRIHGRGVVQGSPSTADSYALTHRHHSAVSTGSDENDRGQTDGTVARSDLYDAVDRKQLMFLVNFTLLEFMIVIGAMIFAALEGWRYRQGVYFCLVTLTTIGYGNLVPTTDGGKIFLLFYGVFGLGLMAAILTTFGGLLVNAAHGIHRRLLPSQLAPLVGEDEDGEDGDLKRQWKRSRGRIWCHSAGDWLLSHFTLVIIVVSVLIFWLLSALLFSLLESWTFLNAVYFSFQTLATIGFGDFIPTHPVSLAYTFFFVFVGLSLFSAFLNALWHPESVLLERNENNADHLTEPVS